MAANADGLPLLQTFQKHIEDMRSLVQCKICIKPLYEPFILSCGHSYCYSCLTSWFTGGHGDQRRRQNMKCPDCRSAVVQEPSPNYVLRDLVHMFIGRTELLPEDETTNEHEVAKGEEAVQMTADRDGVGLFKGAFRNRGLPHQMLHAGLRRHGAMWDPNDRVDRCPECHWELEGGHCNQCDWSISDAEAFSDEDSDSEADEPDFDPATGRVRPRFNARNFLHALDNGGDPFDLDPELSDDPDSVITISSDVDDVDPVDHELAGTDADTHSDAESDLPVAMGGLPRQYHHENAQTRLALERLYESDVQSTNYDNSETGDTNPQTTSEMGDSDEEDETEDDNSSEMEDFLDHDTPTHVPHRALVQNRYDENGDIYISSDNDESGDEGNTDREPSQAPTNTTNASATTVDSNSEESSEDESRRTPVPRSRPSRQTRVILDDSEEEEEEEEDEEDEEEDEEQSQGNPKDDDSNADEPDATTIPAQPTATRRSHLQTQRARRGPNALRRSSVSPPRRPSVPYSRGGFDNTGGSRRPLQASANRRGMAQTYVAG